MNIKRVKLIGVGGIAQCLLLPLFVFLSALQRKKNIEDVEITLLDGDRFSYENTARQINTHPGEYKALVVAEELRTKFPDMFTIGIPTYVTQENIAEFIGEDDIVFMCVDNHATRKLVSDHAEDLANIVIISGGNNFTDGNIQIFIREHGVNKDLPIANEYHRELQYPEDKNPGELGCVEQIASTPQLVFMNNAIAANMLTTFYCYLEGTLDYDELFIDILIGSTRSVRRRLSPTPSETVGLP